MKRRLDVIQNQHNMMLQNEKNEIMRLIKENGQSQLELKIVKAKFA